MKIYGKCCYTCKHGENYNWSGVRCSWKCKLYNEIVECGEICKKYEVKEWYKNKIDL